jgi:hypothetical protein
MHGLAVGKKNDLKKLAAGLRNGTPPSDSAIGSNHLAKR